MKKTLHIGDNASWEGCMKFSMRGLAPKDSYVIMGFDYSFCTACLPRNLSKEELKRDSSWRPFPIGGFYNKKGENMGKWYGFSVV